MKSTSRDRSLTLIGARPKIQSRVHFTFARQFMRIFSLAILGLVPLLLAVSRTSADEPSDGSPAAGHSSHGEAFDEGPRQAAQLIGGTGKVHFPLGAVSDEVQAFFDQGIGQLHGFWYFEAERSFRQAAALDPDCAMAYWGMAMANASNEKRARGFITEAIKRKDGARTHEVLYIEALAEAYDIAPDGKPINHGKKKVTEADHRKQLIKRLESIIIDYPDDLAAKTFLVTLIWESREKGVPITSYLAVDSILDGVFAVEPMHPAHHFRIHLWDSEGKHSARALESAAKCGPAAPSIAHMWHMPGHTYSKLNRFHDAAWQQEAATRVDHAYMIRNHVLPDQIHNYAHNQEWLIRTLAITGRVHEASELAKNMTSLPRHPKFNAIGKSGNTATWGRTRLVEVLSKFELWDELIAAADGPYLDATSDPAEQARRLRALGAAYYSTGKAEAGKARLAELETLLAAVKSDDQAAAKEAAEDDDKDAAADEDEAVEAKEDKPKLDPKTKKKSLTAIEEAVSELKGHEALAANDTKAAITNFDKAKMSKEFMSRVHLQAGDKEKAEKLAREASDRAKNQVYPLVNLVDVLHRAGKDDDAANALGRLRAISSTLDMDLPIVARLAPLAKQHNLPEDWRRPLVAANDIGERPALDTLGPRTWHPATAASFTLQTADGKSVSLDDYSGRPVVLIFYLGFGCLHCVEQLQAFAPMAERFEQAGISLLAISTDSSEALGKSIEKVAKDGKFPIPLVSDSEHKTFKAYRAFDDFEQKPLHATLVLDGRGRILWQDIGPEPFTDATFVLNEAQRLLGLWK